MSGEVVGHYLLRFQFLFERLELHPHGLQFVVVVCLIFHSSFLVGGWVTCFLVLL